MKFYLIKKKNNNMINLDLMVIRKNRIMVDLMVLVKVMDLMIFYLNLQICLAVMIFLKDLEIKEKSNKKIKKVLINNLKMDMILKLK